ncbi:MAG: ATP-dependent helicase, partial [Gammaproteobacteria bacterium]|nr:ATP-dependent helicase [Gammaproteobacteria bacterium]
AEPIVDTLVSVASRMGASEGMLPLELRAHRDRRPATLRIQRHETPADEAAGVAASVRELEDAGVALRRQAVLCRSNSRLNDLATALEERGIAVLHLGSLFEREEVRDLLALLSLAVDRFGDALARVTSMHGYGVSLQDVHAATRHLRSNGGWALTALESLAEADGVSDEGAAGFRRLAEALTGLNPRGSAWGFLSSYLLDRTDFVRKLARATTVTERMRAVAVWQFLNFVREPSPAGSGLPIRRTRDRVRQLVLLAEERDLRQVPAAALHLDAVRLMTVHGSKGLEFDAVHVPGLTSASFPTSNRGQRCPPPVGMIDATRGLSVKEEFKRSHEHEEQCLFFVALSRARSHVRLHLARKQANGRNRSQSEFLGWLPSSLFRETGPSAALPLRPGTARPSAIEVTRGREWSVTDRGIRAYEKCPRRFFYKHVLGLGGAWKATAFSRTHFCLHRFIDWIGEARRRREPTLAEAEAAFEKIWKVSGPIEHAFCDDYRRLASRLVAALVRASAGRRPVEPRPLAFDLPNGRVIVEPSELAELPDGTMALRRIRTGKKRVDEYDRLRYALYYFAAEAQFGDAAVVHALHLTDETDEHVEITEKKLTFRRTKTDRMLGQIAAGSFPPNPDGVVCPRCPYFFICPSIPPGSLALP